MGRRIAIQWRRLSQKWFSHEKLLHVAHFRWNIRRSHQEDDSLRGDDPSIVITAHVKPESQLCRRLTHGNTIHRLKTQSILDLEIAVRLRLEVRFIKMMYSHESILSS